TMSLSSPPLLLLSATLHPSLPTLFPYTTLFRSHVAFAAPPSHEQDAAGPDGLHGRADGGTVVDSQVGPVELEDGVKPRPAEMRGDRKSTRLNSSHGSISYAVFCLKKKQKYDTYK